MEYKFQNNPHIIKFLEQYDSSEWDGIIEDLILYSIKEIKKNEKENQPENKVQVQPKINKYTKIITFNKRPYESATNYLKQNGELKSNSGLKKNITKKLDDLNKKINNIHNINKNSKKYK